MKKLGLTVDNGYFTVKMLERRKNIVKGMKGKNPDLVKTAVGA
jgi:hypothetical protein